MLVPILLLQTNIKQILLRPIANDQDKSLVIQGWNCINRTISRWYWQPIVTTLILIDDLPHYQSQNLNQKLDYKDNYLFAFGQQQKPSIFQEMTAREKQELLEELKSDYRQIIINYFITDKGLKEKIDKFVNALFYASIPVPQIIEMHMEVIDEFAKQLRLEGRSNETLLDYRLTLIDVLAHLCEVYRASVAKII
jgi:circadian clock protein KaiA